MNQNMRVARLMAFLGLYAAQESGAADAGLLARLYPAQLSLADAAELAGLSEEEPARYLREWLYNRRKTSKADRQSTQKALYEALTDYYTEAHLPTDQPLDMQMNLADLATFLKTMPRPARRLCHKSRKPIGPCAWSRKSWRIWWKRRPSTMRP